MSSDENISDYDQETSSDSDEPSIKLQPYDFEPLASSSAEEVEEQTDNNSDNNSEESSRVGNNNWCQCGQCKAMNTNLESLCCVEANEIPDEFFEGILSVGFQHSYIFLQTKKFCLETIFVYSI